MDDRFPERMDDDDVQLLLKELRLAGEKPEWKDEFGPDHKILILYANGMGNARLYEKEDGVWVRQSRKALGDLIGGAMQMAATNQYGEMCLELGVEPVVEVRDLVEDDDE